MDVDGLCDGVLITYAESSALKASIGALSAAVCIMRGFLIMLPITVELV